MHEENWSKKKYLKYKNKYFHLKSQIREQIREQIGAQNLLLK